MFEAGRLRWEAPAIWPLINHPQGESRGPVGISGEA